MTEKPALTEDAIEALAWDLEVAMMRIRKDPQAALTKELAKIRAQQLEDLSALWAKLEADICAKRKAILAQLEEDGTKWRAEREAAMAQLDEERAKMYDELRASREADIAQLDKEWEAAVAELRAARADRLRQEAAEPTRLQ